MSRFRSASLVFRLAIVVLAALQFIAPSWHVCAQGGFGADAAQCHSKVVCHAPDGDDAATDDVATDDVADATRFWRMAVETAQPAAAHDTPFCLAALLQTTPAQTSAAVAVAATFVARTQRALTPLRRVSHFALISPPARGPPLS